MEAPRVCKRPRCNNPVIGSKKQIYCSPRCTRNAAAIAYQRRRRLRERMNLPRPVFTVCRLRGCSNPVYTPPGVSGRPRVYCSPEHRLLAANPQRRKRSIDYALRKAPSTLGQAIVRLMEHMASCPAGLAGVCPSSYPRRAPEYEPCVIFASLVDDCRQAKGWLRKWTTPSGTWAEGGLNRPPHRHTPEVYWFIEVEAKGMTTEEAAERRKPSI